MGGFIHGGHKVISVICCWPTGFDFPLFRQSMPELLNYVDEVLIGFTKHGNYDLSGWIKAHLEGVRFFDDKCEDHSQDWRSRTTNLMLNQAKGDWILSLEQDFIIKSYPHFFHTVNKAMEKYDVIMFPEGLRFHPACLFVKKDLLLKTHRDFSVMGIGRDHFAQVSKELKGLTDKIITLQELDLLPDRDWYHYQGMTDNYFAPKPYFKLPEFYDYNEKCKLVSPMSDYWRGEMVRCSP